MDSRAHIGLKRVYGSPLESDGYRVLVDRLWPRGLTKEAAHVQLWLRDLAPSNELRKWFHAHTERWDEFRKKYLTELRTPEADDALRRLYEVLEREKDVTLLFAAKNTERNNATVLKEFVEGMRKPPRSTGDYKARAQRRKRA